MNHRTRGFALLPVLAVVSSLLVAGAATIQIVRMQVTATTRSAAAQRAFYVADAGVQHALARLDQDSATAPGAGYAPSPISASFGGGSYSVTIAQDPLFAGNPSRKLITSTGSFEGQQATVLGHALVQSAQDPCAQYLMVGEGGNARVAMVVAPGPLTEMFNGNLLANQDVEFIGLAGVTPLASGNVYAARDFISNSTLVLGTPMSANLYRGRNYVNSLDALHLTGFHSANPTGLGSNHHGQVQVITPANLPLPDWERARRDPRTVIVNSATYSAVAPGSGWTNGIWNVESMTLADNTLYYVEGSMNVFGSAGLRLASNATTEIWARGRIGIRALSLLAVGTQQHVRLVGESDVAIGRRIDLTLGTLLPESLTASTDGLGLGTATVGVLNRTNVFAYSQTGEVWVMNSTVQAWADERVCLLSKASQATLAHTAAILSTVRQVRP